MQGGNTAGKLPSDDLGIHFLKLKKNKHMKRGPADDLESWMIYLNNLEGSGMEAVAMGNPGNTLKPGKCCII